MNEACRYGIRNFFDINLFYIVVCLPAVIACFNPSIEQVACKQIFMNKNRYFGLATLVMVLNLSYFQTLHEKVFYKSAELENKN